LISYAVNGTRGAAALPLSIPAAPRGNRCCALRSPPACLTAAGSTRRPGSVRLWTPSMASRPCHSRSGSPISAGTQPLAVKSELKTKSVSLKARFGRPDKAQPPSGNRCRGDNAGWRWRLSGLRGFRGFVTVGRIRRSRHPAIGAAEKMPDDAYRLSGLRGFRGFVTVGRIRRSRHPAVVRRR